MSLTVLYTDVSVCRWTVCTVPGYVLFVNQLLSPRNCFHGLRGEEAVSCREAETERLAVNGHDLYSFKM